MSAKVLASFQYTTTRNKPICYSVQLDGLNAWIKPWLRFFYFKSICAREAFISTKVCVRWCGGGCGGVVLGVVVGLVT